jgi:hypothetical protein
MHVLAVITGTQGGDCRLEGLSVANNSAATYTTTTALHTSPHKAAYILI